MKAVAACQALWRRIRTRTADYLANDDPYAAIANSGAFLVWGNQPFYPIYVWVLVGAEAWPALLTWLSTPFFVAVPLVARRSSIGGRVLFVVAGVANTLLSAKAFGLATDVAWFLLPCLIIAAGFFRRSEWTVAAALTLFVGLGAVALRGLGAPLHAYAPDKARSLAHLNLWSVTVLSLYLVYSAVRVRWEARRPVRS